MAGIFGAARVGLCTDFFLWRYFYYSRSGVAAVSESLPPRSDHRWLRAILTVISVMVLGACILMWCWNEAPSTASLAVSQSGGE